MIINCAYNPLSAITGQPYGQLVQVPGMKAVIADIVHECLAVTEKLGVTLPAPIWPAVEQIAVSMATQISSTAQDLARGKPTEIEHLNGYITRQGVPAPVNQTMYALVKAKESLVL
jgi:2-dehydropantoate 2-reductase